MGVAVLGATGTIGRALVPELVRAHEVVAVSRSPRSSAGNVSSRAADATDPEAMRRAPEGIDVV
ncbi:MAG: NAD(P)H-binding protein [Gaiellaceae bacterium]